MEIPIIGGRGGAINGANTSVFDDLIFLKNDINIDFMFLGKNLIAQIDTMWTNGSE